jgi:type IV pilus assembly protein PilZ
MSSNDNARRHRRQTVRILVDYLSDRGVGCDYATTLGAGGLFIECEEPLPMGSVVKLRFRLPHSDALHELEGRISWTRDGQTGDRSLAPGMGVQFTDPASTGPLARELDHLD